MMNYWKQSDAARLRELEMLVIPDFRKALEEERAQRFRSEERLQLAEKLIDDFTELLNAMLEAVEEDLRQQSQLNQHSAELLRLMELTRLKLEAVRDKEDG